MNEIIKKEYESLKENINVEEKMKMIPKLKSKEH